MMGFLTFTGFRLVVMMILCSGPASLGGSLGSFSEPWGLVKYSSLAREKKLLITVTQSCWPARMGKRTKRHEVFTGLFISTSYVCVCIPHPQRQPSEQQSALRSWQDLSLLQHLISSLWFQHYLGDFFYFSERNMHAQTVRKMYICIWILQLQIKLRVQTSFAFNLHVLWQSFLMLNFNRNKLQEWHSQPRALWKRMQRHGSCKIRLIPFYINFNWS